MSNPWSAPVIKPLSRFLGFLRVQLAGAPAEQAEDAVASIEEHFDGVVAPVVTRIEALEAEIKALRGEAPAVAAEAPDLFAEIREEIAALRARFDAIEIPPASDLEALHKRLAAVEAATAKAAPARAAAPAARPAATTA